MTRQACRVRRGTLGICDTHGRDLADCSNRAREAIEYLLGGVAPFVPASDPYLVRARRVLEDG